jgi:aspartate carbamoyltransferase catalytic subunit
MKFEGRHILSTKQFDKSALIALFEKAGEMEEQIKEGKSDILSGKILASLFFEPSTRTRFSFEAAMQRLRGGVVSNADMMNTSSLTKLETLYDTGKVVSQIADVIVMRHPEAGSVAKLAEGSDVPVINAGDGPSEHPTQGLLDLYTIWKNYGKIDGLTIGLVGDLKNSRVLHSNSDLLKHFDVKFVLVSPEELCLPEEIENDLKESGCEFVKTDDLLGSVGDMDVLNCNRLQVERFKNSEDAEKYRGSFQVNNEILKAAKKDMIVLCPLPRMEEILKEVDDDPRAKYFQQVENGVAVRMALLAKVLGV